MKKLRLLVVAVVAVAIASFAGCGKGTTPEKPEQPYVPQDGVYTYHELTKWGASAAAGKAVQDGEYTKITSSTAQFGGIKSSNGSDAITIDFSKPAYINFTELSASAGTAIVFKMRVVGYNLNDSAYIMSNEFMGIDGDFSINIQDAIQFYKGAATNAELIYKIGDEDLDDETGLGKIAEGDPRIGELKFASVTKKIKCLIEVWCFGPDGVNTSADFIRFKSFSLTNETEKIVTEVKANQADLTGDAAVIKASPSITLAPTLTKTDKASGKLVFLSSNPDRVPVSEAGVVDFNRVTSQNVKISVISRDDITKQSAFYVGVIIDIKTASDVKSHLDDLSFVDNVTAIDEVVPDILSGDILKSQQVAYASGDLKAIRAADSVNTVTVFNNYDKTNADMTAEKDVTGGKYKLKVTLPKAALTWADATLSCYNVDGAFITRLVDNAAVALDTDKFVSEFSVPYLNGDDKITGVSTIVVVWSNGAEAIANRVEIDNKDVSKIDSEYRGDSLEGFFEPFAEACGTSSLNENKQLVLKNDKTKYYMNMVANFSFVGDGDKPVFMAIDIASMDTKTYANVQYNNAYVLTNQILNNKGEALWIINLSEIIKGGDKTSVTMLFDFLLNGGEAGGEEEVIIDSVMLYC